jgi:hypothetical protein
MSSADNYLDVRRRFLSVASHLCSPASSRQILTNLPLPSASAYPCRMRQARWATWQSRHLPSMRRVLVMNKYLAAIASSALVLLAPASGFARNCQKIGNTVVCDDGTSYNKIGNTTLGSDGSSSTQIGNTRFHSDGSSSQQIGNTRLNSDGSSSQRIGNTILKSDGTSCQIIGNQMLCN